MKESPSILSRLLSAFVGLLTGVLVGMLALYFVMLLVGSDFGLDNVRAGLGRMEQQPNGKPFPHDFRLCAVRNLDRAGVSQSVAMQMTGHKTPSIYHIGGIELWTKGT
jgi:hypothetical protein